MCKGNPQRRLSPLQVQNFIDKYKEPEKAKALLTEMGFLDENGELLAPYRPETLHIEP